MTAYYNEVDRYAAEWLRNLVQAGHIAHDVVDERSIEDVHPADLRGFTQCHFFAGVGVWSLALRRAGWTDDRPVWTGSCPCQPFSSAGQGAAFADERHLWPAFFHLIEKRRPAVVLGEQVASRDADAWIDLVQADMEGLGYPFGAVAFPSAGVGAPHMRDRMYWVADGHGQRRGKARRRGLPGGCAQRAERGGHAGRLGDTHHAGLEGHAGHDGDARRSRPARSTASAGLSGRLVHALRERRRAGGHAHAGDDGAELAAAGALQLGGLADADRFVGGQGSAIAGGWAARGDAGPWPRSGRGGHADGPGPVNGLWRAADWLACRDGRWRPVEPGTFPLAHGAAARVGRLRAYGNAINAEAARVFIEAVMEALP